MAYIGQSLTEGTRRVYTYVATASQTTFNAVYGVGAVDVYQNGILLAPADYTASNGTTVVLGTGAAYQDEITIVCHNTFSVADTVSASQGGTFNQPVTIDGNGATALTVDRATSDGTIIDVQMNGTTVGSIGSNAGAHFTIGNSDTGLLFNASTDKIHPWNMSTQGVRDNSIDLGVNVSRFKDLYLGGTIDLSNAYTDTYILKSNHPTTGVYTATDGTHDHWITLKSYGGTHVVLNTDGARTSGRNSQDHFTVWQKEKDHTNGRACFSVDNIGQAYFGSAGVSIDRGWGGYPSITVHRTGWNSNSNAALGEFRIHGYSGEELDWWTGAQGSDFSVNLRIDGGTYISSDRRKKTDIESLSGAVDTVLQLDGKRFKVVNNEGTPENNFSQSGYKMGFIAQEIETVIPDAVKHYPDEDDGTDGYNNAYSVDYASIVALLTNAIKEQQATIDDLKSRVAALETPQGA